MYANKKQLNDILKPCTVSALVNLGMLFSDIICMWDHFKHKKLKDKDLPFHFLKSSSVRGGLLMVSGTVIDSNLLLQTSIC